MFDWINKQGVVSDEGYTLQRIQRFCYHYSEGDLVLQVDVESGIKYEKIFLSKNMHWNVPNNLKPINEEKFVKIEKNINEALIFMKIQHKIVWDNKIVFSHKY